MIRIRYSMVDYWTTKDWATFFGYLAMVPGGIIFAVYWIIASILQGTALMDCLGGVVLGVGLSVFGYVILRQVQEWERSVRDTGCAEDIH